ncbi:MAG: transglycosylase domain-containing protein [Oligoflexus sp.]
MKKSVIWWLGPIFICLLALALLLRELSQVLQEAEAEVVSILEIQSPQPSVVYDRHGQKIGQFGSQYHEFISLERIPIHVRQSFISAEDRGFWSHHGVSLISLMRAAWANLLEARWAQGASTITQQLVRLQLLSREKKLSRKIQEMILAIALEKTASKEKILEIYLNRVFFGNGAYGIAAAAQVYFRKPAEALSWSEASFLAGLIRAPSRYDPFDKKGWNLARQRQQYVLRRLVDDEIITAHEAEDIYRQKPKLVAGLPALGEFGYAMFAVRKELERMVQGLDWQEGGYQIETGLDLRLLKTIKQASKRMIQTHPFHSLDSEMAIMAMDANSGDVLGLIGGKNFHSSQFNRAIQMRRPIGSIALPLIYAKALSHGFQLGDRLYSLKTNTHDRNDPTLFDGLAKGLLMESTRLGVEIGLGNLRNYFHQLGWQTDREDFDLILGLEQLSPLELTTAYAAIANGGFHVKARLLKRVRDRHGQTIMAVSPMRQRVLPYQSAYVMGKALQKIQALSNEIVINDSSAIGGYHAVGPARQNFWQILFDDRLVLTSWVGSDSGLQALPAEAFWQPRKSSKDFYRILVDEGRILDTMMLKEPNGIRYHWVDTLTFREQKVFLPFTARSRW